MTTWNRTLDFYLDVDPLPGVSSPLLTSKASSPATSLPVLIQADTFTVRLFFRKRSATAGGASTAMEVPAGSNIVLAAKLASNLAATTLLFSCTSFTAEGAGDDLCYTGELDLNTSELATAMATATSITARIDVEVQNAGNTERFTFQFDVTVKKQAYAGESTPTPGTPTYPLPVNLLIVLACGTQAITNGLDYVQVTGLGLGEVPAQVLLTIRKPAGGANLAATVRDASVGTDGFIADLTASAPAAGYKVDYLLFKRGS